MCERSCLNCKWGGDMDEGEAGIVDCKAPLPSIVRANLEELDRHTGCPDPWSTPNKGMPPVWGRYHPDKDETEDDVLDMQHMAETCPYYEEAQ